MSTLAKTDPRTDLLLDFIAQGESGGNYNAVIGNSHSKDDLSKKTLNDIYALMTHLVNSGQPSTAIGRYQFIRSTLQATVAMLGANNQRLFTPEFQDKLCVELLVKACRYEEWYTGKISDVLFAHLLSTQWASLPDPQNGGKSHYDGVGPNHAGTTLPKVYAMLTAARKAPVHG